MERAGGSQSLLKTDAGHAQELTIL